MATSSAQDVLINGKRDAALSPLDRGLAYGDGVFRTMLVRKGIPCVWDLHYKKLVDDCNALGIVCPSGDQLMGDIDKLFSKKEDAVVKIIITRGESIRGYALPPLAQPSRIVMRSTMPAYPASYISEGVKLHLCDLKLSHQPLLAGIKHLNRLENVLARTEWQDATIADGLMLDIKGLVIETTASNLFARYDQLLVTPDLSQCGVAGVTRQRIIDQASSLGFEVKIADIALSELMQADEIITCNSLYGTWQVRELNHHIWPKQYLANQLRQFLQVTDALN
ncbi:aminodeoxychorismate lyase [Methylovorus sp. MM2]|uniref:aminodeoxychorismate lyase n=1 Tax=Methylovorus sp. MM2 TaxID=1848038 RepID=UPI0007E201A7|nr:aminodeoxychorismate lyase [Methylovorus sp. MM2]OAM53002.1 aminodeoxychorismate lyase [Methylovorus sp. MM2]